MVKLRTQFWKIKTFMTLTFIIMDSLYIMRNLLILFCLMVVFWTNLGNCAASSCDEPAPPDYLVSHSPDFAEGEMYANGTEIMYDCPDGYDLNGNTTAVCLYGVWTYEDAFCTASSCDEPAPPDDLVFHSPDFAEGEMYAHGTEIMYDCPDGLDLNGHMTAVCLYGVWTYEDAYCTASSCDEPATPDDFVFHSPNFAKGEMYPNGTEIMYDCPDGLDLNGHMTSVCLYGVWTYEDAICTGIDTCDKYTQCHYDETRVNSTVSCNIETANGNTAPPCYGDGSIITCSCKSENYQLSSPDNSYLCTPDKLEDGLYDLHCLTALPCDEPAPPDDLVIHSPQFAEGEMYANGTEIMYDCPDGLDLKGHMTAVCLYGKWTYENAFCIASPCDEPAPPDDLVFHSPDFAEGEMYAHGTEIMYDCPDGLDLKGHMTAVCLYGVWTYEDAYCTGFCDKYTQCHYDETRMHSTVSCNIETAGNTSPPCYGERSNITCSCKSENYQLSRPDNSFLCTPDKWEDGLYDLYCLPSPCDEPAPPDDLVIHSLHFAEGEKYANGTEIMYDCPDVLDLNGHMTAVCLYGKWTNEDAYCTASPCDKPAPPDDLVFHSPDFAEGEMYENGTEIMYDCPDGLDLNGHMTAVCLYGEWTYEDAYCTDSCDKYTQCFYNPARMDRTASCNIEPAGNTAPPCYGNGSKVTCSCNNRQISPKNSYLCRPDKWEDGLYDFHCSISSFSILLVIIIAIYTLLFAVLLIWLVKKHCLRRGTKWIPSVEGVANEQVPPTANDESKFVSKVIFEMRDPNAYQNDVNKEENDVTDHVGDNSPDDSPNNDPEEETV